MNILFIYDSPLIPEVGGTERATKLVMDELSRIGYHCFGLLHYDQSCPEEQFYNNKKIDSLFTFLVDNQIDVVVNQIAFHPRFLNQFLALGGQKWKDNGGKIISFMHLDPTPAPRKRLSSFFEGWKDKTIFAKIKRLALICYNPILNLKLKRGYRIGLRSIYENSDRYVVMSTSYINVMIKQTRLSDLSKLRVIPNMLTFPEIVSHNQLFLKQNMVIVVARLDDEQKNISFIIDVWKQIKDHRGYALHIIGDGKDRVKLQHKAKNVKDVFFEGFQSPLKWYRQAKISLMASPREGWGLTITESLQNGVVPIVMNNSLVFQDIIESGYNGYLAHTQQEYITFLSNIINCDSLRLKLAQNAIQSASRFSSQSVGKLWKDMLDDIYL